MTQHHQHEHPSHHEQAHEDRRDQPGGFPDEYDTAYATGYTDGYTDGYDSGTRDGYETGTWDVFAAFQGFRPDERTDKELMADYVAGDRDALGVLFARHRRFLVWKAHQETDNWADAENAVSEAWIKVLHYAEDYRATGSVRNWLAKVVQTTSRSLWRLAYPQRFTAYEPEVMARVATDHRDARYDGHAGPPDNLTWDQWSTREAHRDALAAEIADQVAKLPPRRREIISRMYLEGCTRTEIAEELALAFDTVKNTLHHGRNQLRPLIEHLLFCDE